MNHPRATVSARLFDGLYTEAMLLADEARAYFESWGRDERDALDPELRVLFSCESLRVTTRLMHVIAWLLTRRAVAAGEMSAAQGVAPERRLGALQPSEAAIVAMLPDTARQLVQATIDLHGRVMRLETQLDPRQEDSSGPARRLIARLRETY